MTSTGSDGWLAGAERAYGEWDQGRTGFGTRPVFLVIDMQREYADPACTWSFESATVADSIALLLPTVRKIGMPVIYTYNGFRDDLTDAGLMPVKSRDLRTHPICREGSDGAKVIADIEPQPGDYIINKKRFSAFFGTDLEVILRGLNADTVIVTGCVTSGCIRMTSYDAFQRDYRVVIPAECVGDQTPEIHQQALYIMNLVVADVMPLADVKAYLESHPQHAGSPPVAELSAVSA